MLARMEWGKAGPPAKALSADSVSLTYDALGRMVEQNATHRNRRRNRMASITGFLYSAGGPGNQHS